MFSLPKSVLAVQLAASPWPAPTNGGIVMPLLLLRARGRPFDRDA